MATMAYGPPIQPHRGHQLAVSTGYRGYGWASCGNYPFPSARIDWDDPSYTRPQGAQVEIIQFDEAVLPEQQPKKNPNGYRQRKMKARLNNLDKKPR